MLIINYKDAAYGARQTAVMAFVRLSSFPRYWVYPMKSRSRVLYCRSMHANANAVRATRCRAKDILWKF